MKVLRLILAGLGVTLAMQGAGAGSAYAVSSGVACSVSGSVTIRPGISMTPHLNDYVFSGGAGCTGVGDDNGGWTITATARTAATETCVAATGNGDFTGGSTPTSTITGGKFTFVRVGTVVVVSGEVISSDGIHHEFVAVLNFIPDQNCVVNPVTSATILGGAAIETAI